MGRWEGNMAMKSQEADDEAPVRSKSTFRRWWSVGCLGVLGLAVVVAVVALAMISYRARVQAAVAAELERNEALPVYALSVFAIDQVEGRETRAPWSASVPHWLRERLGEDYVDDVIEVIATRYVPASDGMEPLTEEQTRNVCDLCGRLPKLKRFFVKSESFELEQIASWPRFSRLTDLGIDCDNLSDDDVKAIGELKNLRCLELQSAQVTDAGLRHLAELTELTELQLDSETLTDEGIRHLAGLTKIRNLHLDCPNVTDAGLSHLARLDQLRNLRLKSPRIGDAGVLALPPNHLEEVVLSECPVGDRGAGHLVSGGRVRALVLRDSLVTYASLPELVRGQSLYALSLTGAKLSDEGLAALSNSGIDSLILDKTPITDEGLKHLVNLGRNRNAGLQGAPEDWRVSRISLADTRVSGVGAQHLANYTYISELDLSGAPLTPEGLAQIARLKVSELKLSRTPVTDEGLLLLVPMDETREIDVRQTQVTAQGVRNFMDARVKHCVQFDKDNSLHLNSDFRWEDLPESALTDADFTRPEQPADETSQSADSAAAAEGQP
jgi:Leucine-rich repeat (LRR) protein